MKHLDIRVRGLVQGVWFRASTREEAHRLRLGGTVRNEPDGSVFIEAEGEAAPLDEFVAWCRVGPPAADVEDLEITEGAVQGLDEFHVTG